MSSDEANGTVRFTVKELLARLDQKMDDLGGRIDSRFDGHEQRIRRLETEAVTEDALNNARKEYRGDLYRAVGAGVAVLGVIIAAANYFLG